MEIKIVKLERHCPYIRRRKSPTPSNIIDLTSPSQSRLPSPTPGIISRASPSPVSECVHLTSLSPAPSSTPPPKPVIIDLTVDDDEEEEHTLSADEPGFPLSY